VKDAGGLTNSITKAVTVGSVTNQPPVAAFTFSCSNTTRLCSFNGTGSTDDVGIVSYAWTFGDGGTASTSTTSHTYAAPGTFQVTLTVTDGGGLSNAITKAVTLTNQPPVAAFTSSCNNTTRACTFNGSGSTDDVGIVSYAWNFGDAATGTGATPAHTYASAGTYTVTLTVTDGGGLTNAVSHTVTLTTGTNQPPVAAYTVTCQPAPAHTCSLDGTGSVDPDGSIVAYKWTNAEGQVLSTAATFTKSWGASYSPTFTLTVTDNGGLTGKLTKTFTVP
jgi:PKD repeat protein